MGQMKRREFIKGGVALIGAGLTCGVGCGESGGEKGKDLLEAAGLDASGKEMSQADLLDAAGETVGDGGVDVSAEAGVDMVMEAKDYVEDTTQAGTFPGPGRVIHVRNPDAVSWDYSSGYYGDHVDALSVEMMVRAGLRQLTGAGSAAMAWAALLPDYSKGQRFAIKVNLLNPKPNDSNIEKIHGLPEPADALVKTLVEFGVPAGDITLYDATGSKCGFSEKYFKSRVTHQVNYVGSWTAAGIYSDQTISFKGGGISPVKIAKCLVEADYLINIPTVKAHTGAVISLGFKNHLGSISNCGTTHAAIPCVDAFGWGSCGDSYTALMDIMSNPHFAAKTVLTAGELLFGSSYDFNSKPSPWKSFGGVAPASMFFSADPVACDAVMADFVEAEQVAAGIGALPEKGRVYLTQAATAGMGLNEKGDPWGAGYTTLDYTSILLT